MTVTPGEGTTGPPRRLPGPNAVGYVTPGGGARFQFLKCPASADEQVNNRIGLRPRLVSRRADPSLSRRYAMKRLGTLTLGVALLFGAGALRADDQAEMRALVEKAVKAHGGAEALEKAQA